MAGHRDNRPVLVGASGQVGRRIGSAWSAAGQDFTPVSRQPGGAAVWDMDRAPPPLPEARGRAVIVLSGVVPGPGADLSRNTAMAQAGIAAARGWGAAHCFVLSTSAVYGPTGISGADENASLAGASDYARAKIEMERRITGPGVTVLRLANVAGASQPFLALEGAAPPMLDRFADGSGPSRSFIGPVTLARVLSTLSALAQRGGAMPRVLNLAEPRPVAMAELFHAAGRRIVWRDAPAEAVQHVHLDVARLATLLDAHGLAEASHIPGFAAGAGCDAARLWAEARVTEAQA